jgi:hypothetical protein
MRSVMRLKSADFLDQNQHLVMTLKPQISGRVAPSIMPSPAT